MGYIVVSDRKTRPIRAPRPRTPAPALPPVQGAQWVVEYTLFDGSRGKKAIGAGLTVGRQGGNGLQLLDPEISKTHLRLAVQNGALVLTDVGSANGTIVNGHTVKSCVLSVGDSVLIGNSTLRVRRVEAPREERTQVTFVPELSREGATQVVAIPSAAFPPSRDWPALESQVTGRHTPAKPASRERARETLSRDYERLRVAFELAKTVGVGDRIDTLSERVLETILSVLPADAAVLMVLEGGVRPLPLASFAADGRSEVRVPRAIVERVVRSGEGLLTHDALADRQLRTETVVGHQIRSAMCVPLVAAGETIGVLHMSSSLAAGAYGERDLQLLQAVAQPVALAIANARLLERARRDAETRAVWSRFLSPALVERAVADEISLEAGGDPVVASVLFADIRGFTALAEGQSPRAVVAMLNEYFEAMVEVIFAHGGVLDKFIGDGLMAVWGTPVARAGDAAAAARAARRMQRVLEQQVNKARRARGEQPLAMGIGVATGPVIAGAMGASRRQDFTVIGEPVNLASRLCSLAGAKEVVVDERTAHEAQEARLRVHAMGSRAIKGVAKPVPVFGIDDVD